MELIVKNPNIPIKAIPDIDTIFETQVKAWLSILLSIKSDKEMQLDEALKGIKKHCWSLGFNEIKKMFEMYVDGELSVKPVSSYLDRALVGQIFQAYKMQSRTKPKTTNEAEYKKEHDDIQTIICFDEWKQDLKVKKEFVWVYDYLEFRKLVKFDVEIKKEIYTKELETHDKETSITNSKLILLGQYFEKIKEKGLHIKNLL